PETARLGPGLSHWAYGGTYPLIPVIPAMAYGTSSHRVRSVAEHDPHLTTSEQHPMPVGQREGRATVRRRTRPVDGVGAAVPEHDGPARADRGGVRRFDPELAVGRRPDPGVLHYNRPPAQRAAVGAVRLLAIHPDQPPALRGRPAEHEARRGVDHAE